MSFLNNTHSFLASTMRLLGAQKTSQCRGFPRMGWLREEGDGVAAFWLLSGSLWGLTVDGIYVTRSGHRGSGHLHDLVTTFLGCLCSLKTGRLVFKPIWTENSIFFLKWNREKLASFSLASKIRYAPTQAVGWKLCHNAFPGGIRSSGGRTIKDLQMQILLNNCVLLL